MRFGEIESRSPDLSLALNDPVKGGLLSRSLDGHRFLGPYQTFGVAALTGLVSVSVIRII